MKNTIFILSVLFLSYNIGLAQSEVRKVPSVSVKTLNNKTVNAASIDNKGRPVVINFWATWCKPCVRELDAIADVYEEWQEETGVQIIAVSIDDSRNSARVSPFVNGKGWDYTVLLDPNGDLKRAMGVNNPPHTFVLNGKNEIIWQHNGYADGDEDELFEVIQKTAEGKE